MKIELLPQKTKIPMGLLKKRWNIIPKVLCLFFVFFCIPICLDAEEIDFPKNEKISLIDALQQLSKDYQVFFSYDQEIVQNIKVNFEPEEYTGITHALDEMLVGTSLKYKVFNNRYIILYERSPEALSSLRGMVEHLETVIDSEEKISFRTISSPPVMKLSARSTILPVKQIAFTVTGTITDDAGEPLIGVNIQVKGSNKGTATDFDGKFILENIDENTVLVISYVGYQTQEIPIAGKSSLEIILISNLQLLDEVVVVGYGSVKKSDLTGSISSVSSKDLNAFPTTNVLQALTGRAAGVQVTQNNGEPGGGISVRIRGTNSIRGSNEPLYVIDGFPTSGSNPTILNNLDIESIEILKDASATAIYGSRGANGVVLITTKGGNKDGKTSIHLESNYGIQSIRKKMDMMNAREYAEFYNIVADNDGWGSAFTDSEVNSFGEGFDWQDFVFRKAPIQNHSLSINGGGEKTQFFISGSIYDEEGIIKNSGYERYSLRSVINHTINKKIKVNAHVTLSKINRQNQSSGGGGRGVSLIGGTLMAFPTITPYNEDGSWRDLRTIYHWSPELSNPGLYIYETDSNVRSNKILANTSIEYKPIPQLTLKIMGGIENSDDRNDSYRTNNFIGSSSNASVGATQFTSLLNENTLSYSQQFQKHSLGALVGFTYQDFLNTSLGGSGTNFLSDIQESYNLGSASIPGIPSSSYSLSTIISGISRINYNYDERFLATVSFRADGSSKYSTGNKWGYFPSGSIAWRLSNEDFLRNSNFIEDLKIRIGWGSTGSQAIGAYATLNSLSSSKTVLGGQLFNAFSPSTTLPGELRWETTKQANIGLDLGLIKNRLYISADYYDKVTSDLLNIVPLPLSGGFTSRITNVGEIGNKGLELSINSILIDKKSLNWTIDGNISFNRSKVIKLNKSDDIHGTSINVTLLNDYFNLLREGEPFSVFYGYLDDGYTEDGLIGKYIDINNDGIINSDDRIIIGDPNPDFIYGINSQFSYKGFQLGVFMQGTYGNDIFNLAGVNNTLDVGFGGNMPKEVLYDMWSPSNLNAKYPNPSRNSSIRFSDRFIEDGSYLRFRNIQLSYQLPLNMINKQSIGNIQLFVSGKNLITITKYSRWDPEVNSLGGSNSINQGIDYHSYPTNKSINFGISLDL